MPELLTFSFKHLFELTRELSISEDQVADHSRNDHAAVSWKLRSRDLERTSLRHPRGPNVFAQTARARDAGFQRAFPHC